MFTKGMDNADIRFFSPTLFCIYSVIFFKGPEPDYFYFILFFVQWFSFCFVLNYIVKTSCET